MTLDEERKKKITKLLNTWLRRHKKTIIEMSENAFDDLRDGIEAFILREMR